MKTKGYVFTNGYGLVKFVGFGISDSTPTLYEGYVKLPKGITTGGGSKWIKHGYLFAENQVFESKKEALKQYE